MRNLVCILKILDVYINFYIFQRQQQGKKSSVKLMLLELGGTEGCFTFGAEK